MSDFNIAIPADTVLTFRGDAVPIANVAPAGVLYLILNGWSQSMTDTATSARAKVVNDAIGEWAKANGRQPNATERDAIIEGIADAIKAAETDALAKRLEAIMQGTMVAGQRGGGGPRKSALEVYLWGRAKAEAESRLRAKGKRLPKETADANAVIEKVLAHFRAKWEKEFAKGGTDDILDL